MEVSDLKTVETRDPELSYKRKKNLLLLLNLSSASITGHSSSTQTHSLLQSHSFRLSSSSHPSL